MLLQVSYVFITYLIKKVFVICHLVCVNLPNIHQDTAILITAAYCPKFDGEEVCGGPVL
jgi:hypothetical protein